jgi:hypothetical protein
MRMPIAIASDSLRDHERVPEILLVLGDYKLTWPNVDVCKPMT